MNTCDICGEKGIPGETTKLVSGHLDEIKQWGSGGSTGGTTIKSFGYFQHHEYYVCEKCRKRENQKEYVSLAIAAIVTIVVAIRYFSPIFSSNTDFVMYCISAFMFIILLVVVFFVSFALPVLILTGGKPTLNKLKKKAETDHLRADTRATDKEIVVYTEEEFNKKKPEEPEYCPDCRGSGWTSEYNVGLNTMETDPCSRCGGTGELKG